MIRIILSAALVVASWPASAFCTLAHGGHVEECAAIVDAMGSHVVRPGSYRSAGTFVLRNAACVSRGAVFHFHSAYNDDRTKALSDDGNNFQRDQLYQYPRLLGYLDAIGAFQSRRMVALTAENVARLGGPPVCSR